MNQSQNSTHGSRRPSVVPSASSLSDANDLALAIQLVRQLREGIEQSGAMGPASADGSLVEQLHALYANREELESQLGTSEPTRIFERMKNLEGQLETVKSSLSSLGQHLGNGDLVEFVVQTESTIKSLTEQLHGIYEEREGDSGEGDVTASLVEQLHALYADRERLTHAFGSADAEDIASRVVESERSLVEQLQCLYDEREEIARESGPEAPLAIIKADRETIESMAAQLAILYADKESAPANGHGSARSALDEVRARFFGT